MKTCGVRCNALIGRTVAQTCILPEGHPTKLGFRDDAYHLFPFVFGLQPTQVHAVPAHDHAMVWHEPPDGKPGYWQEKESHLGHVLSSLHLAIRVLDETNLHWRRDHATWLFGPEVHYKLELLCDSFGRPFFAEELNSNQTIMGLHAAIGASGAGAILVPGIHLVEHAIRIEGVSWGKVPVYPVRFDRDAVIVKFANGNPGALGALLTLDDARLKAVEAAKWSPERIWDIYVEAKKDALLFANAVDALTGRLP